VSPVKYELGFYIPEDAILHSHCRENLKYYIIITILMQFNSNVYLRQFLKPIISNKFVNVRNVLQYFPKML
jgi:hypothetical protein